jgi:hypothetical protein
MIPSNIPGELAALKQWVVWKIEHTDSGRPTKIPYNPITFNAASSTDAHTWVTFNEACEAYSRGVWDGIGFVLSADDPFTFIDLDDPYALNQDGTPKHKDPARLAAIQQEIYARFKGTYAEFSPSGKGLHIIVKGNVPSGRRRHSVEVYSSARFMTMTGNVYEPGPILERQAALTWLYNELGGAPVVSTYTGEFVDAEPDSVIIQKCLNAANGDKVRDLVNGDWQKHYTSQSEADFALINIIAYYTKSRFQIVRLFRMSALGQRDKAKRDAYVMGMVDRAFDRTPSPLDIDAITNMVNAEFGEWKSPGNAAASTEAYGAAGTVTNGADGSGAVSNTATPTFMPPNEGGRNPYLQPVPGLLGQIAYYIYDQAPRPVPEIALAGAIGLMAGICGRAYNISGTGLNQYTLLLTGTGRGKEAIQSGISKLMNKVTDLNHGGCLAASEFMGPGEISSGQALIKHFDKVSRSFFSLIGEVDVTLKNMTARNANAGLTKFRQVLLASYSASGRDNILPGTIYSDRDKNAPAIQSPALSIIGEGTPQRFYNLLDEAMVSDGLLPRFTIIEYDGRRVSSNEERMNVQPPTGLVKATAQLCGQALMYNQQNRPVDVQLDPDAQQIMRLFDREIDDLINSAGNDTIEQLWNRAHLKALKLAALCAVGVNPHTPLVTAEIAQWAISIIEYSTKRLVVKFQSGDVGEGMTKQHADMRKAIIQMLSITDHRARKLGMSPEMVRDRLISHRGLQQAIANYSSFRNARETASRAYQDTIKFLMDGGILREVGRTDLISRYGKDTGRYYVLVDPGWLNEE